MFKEKPLTMLCFLCEFGPVAEPHNFYADPAPGENLDAAPAAPAPTPTLLYSKSKCLKGIKVTIRSEIFFVLIHCNKNCSKYACRKSNKYI
jgi:hypothetical protein